MTTALSILNLSDRKRNWLAPDARIKAAEIDSPNTVPKGGFLILYIVGHGAQNGLVDSQGNVIGERKVYDDITKRRQEDPTLIIWDVCYAASTLQIGASNANGSPDAPFANLPNGTSLNAINSWPENFIHFFSCRWFERTWHSGHRTNPGRTVFSKALCDAVGGLAAQPGGKLTWKNLEVELRRAFGRVQQPAIVPTPDSGLKWQPSEFDLAKWLGGGGQPATISRPGPPSATIDLR